MKQVIIKDGAVKCETTEPYTPEIIKLMKQAGYKVKEVDDNGKTVRRTGNIRGET